jgi:hypothetical protein
MTLKKVVLAVALVSSFGMLATTQAQYSLSTINPSVEVDKAVIMGEQTSTIVLVEVTVTCIVNDTVDVTITQAPADSSNGIGGSAKGSEPVACTTKPRRIAVSIPNGAPGVASFNLGKATIKANLATLSTVSDSETVGIGFPGGGGEDH